MSVHKKANGTWCVRFRTPDNVQRQKTFDRKADAERYEREQRVALQSGTWTSPDGSKLLLADIYKDYADSKLGLKPKSIEANRSLWDYHLDPKFGSLQIGAINVRSAHEWMKSSVIGDGSYTTTGRIQKAFKLLASVLDYAVDMGHLQKNPLRKSNGQLNNLKLPKNDKTRTIVALTPEELMKLAPECGKFETMVLITGLCGLRWGEIVGLQVQDVDPNGKQLIISRTISEVSGTFHEESTKNHQTRVVQVPELMQQPLRLAVLGKELTDLVFPNALGKPLSSSNFRSRVFNPAVVAAGVPRVTPHDLRHTAASNAIAIGANIMVVSRMLGHSDPSVTLRYYGHLFTEDQEKLAQGLNERFSIEKLA